MTYRSEDIDSVGFRRNALLKFLSLDGINLPVQDTPQREEMRPAPPWAFARRGLRRLTLIEAANVLIGVDPLDTDWRSDDEWRELEGAKRVLLEAVEAKELHVVEIDFNNDGIEIFNAAEVKAWALAAGYNWPIPDMPKISIESSGVNDADLLQRLQESERERNELRAEVEKLRIEKQRISDQTNKLADQAGEIGQLKANLDLAKTEIGRLQTEMAQGKSLSTLQKLVITMAMNGYGYIAGDSRSSIPKEIEGASIEFGIAVTDDTVRKYLKQAASHLPAHIHKPK